MRNSNAAIQLLAALSTPLLDSISFVLNNRNHRSLSEEIMLLLYQPDSLVSILVAKITTKCNMNKTLQHYVFHEHFCLSHWWLFKNEVLP